MKQLLLSVAAITAFGLSTPAKAQGVPTFDGSQLGQLVAQLEHMAEDLNVQLQQLATMRLELETQLSQLLKERLIYASAPPVRSSFDVV